MTPCEASLQLFITHLYDLLLGDSALAVSLSPSIHQLNSEPAASLDISRYTIRRGISITGKYPIRASELTDLTYHILHCTISQTQTLCGEHNFPIRFGTYRLPFPLPASRGNLKHNTHSWPVPASWAEIQATPPNPLT